MAKHINLQ